MQLPPTRSTRWRRRPRCLAGWRGSGPISSARTRRAGVHNWEARGVPEGPAGEARIADLAGQADVVLVDAPCSGLGALRRNPDARWRLDQAEVDSFPPRQREILQRYAALVKPGGRLIYATCSINRAENQDVRADFLARHPGFEP